MTVLPIVARELHVLAANGRFYWARTMVAGFAVLSCLQWFSFTGALPAGPTAGQTGLELVSAIGLVLALSTVGLTADAIAHERREGTLALLFLSTLGSRDVVLGKMAALGWGAFYALLGFAPVLMLTLLPGGVTGAEVVRTILVLLNILFVSLAAGLAVSVLARSQMSAFINAFGLLAGLNVLPFLLEALTRATIKPSPAWFSPVFSFYRAGGKAYGLQPASFWGSLGLSHLVGWLLLGLATFALARNWRMLHEPRAVRSTLPQSRRWIGAPRVVHHGAEYRRRTFAPVARAVLRLPQQRLLAYIAAAISILGSVWNAILIARLGSGGAAGSVLVAFEFASLGLFAFLAGRFLFESRRSGELELLLVTPVGAKGILREQRLALLRMFRGPLYLAVLGAIPAAVTTISLSHGNDVLGLLQALCQMANVALGILAVCSVGMWFGTRVNSALAIAACAAGWVEVLPAGLVYLLPGLFLGAAFKGWLVIVGPLLVAKNLLFIGWAWSRLRREFRTRDRGWLAQRFPGLSGGQGQPRLTGLAN